MRPAGTPAARPVREDRAWVGHSKPRRFQALARGGERETRRSARTRQRKGQLCLQAESLRSATPWVAAPRSGAGRAARVAPLGHARAAAAAQCSPERARGGGWRGHAPSPSRPQPPARPLTERHVEEDDGVARCGRALVPCHRPGHHARRSSAHSSPQAPPARLPPRATPQLPAPPHVLRAAAAAARRAAPSGAAPVRQQLLPLARGRAGRGAGGGRASQRRHGVASQADARAYLLLCKIRRAGERHAAGGSAAAAAAEAGARVRGNLRPGVGQCGGSSERARRRKQAKQRTKATRQYGESDRLATDVARLSAPLAAVPLTPGAPPHLRPRLLPPPHRADVWWRVGWRRRRL